MIILISLENDFHFLFKHVFWNNRICYLTTQYEIFIQQATSQWYQYVALRVCCVCVCMSKKLVTLPIIVGCSYTTSSPVWSYPIPGTVTHLSRDGYPPFLRQSPTMPMTVTHHPKESHPPIPGWSTTVPMTVIHLVQDSYPTSPGRSPTIPRSVTHHHQVGYSPFKGQW